jgi:hypothetical protein
MESLLVVLERTLSRLRRPRARRIAAIGALSAGAVAGIVAAAMASGAITRDPAQECDDGGERLKAAWNPVERSAALDRISNLSAYGRSLAPRLALQIQQFGDRWREGNGAACKAHRSGAHSADLLDRRVACLDRARAALSALGAAAAAADETGLPQLAVAARSLPESETCADLQALLASSSS